MRTSSITLLFFTFLLPIFSPALTRAQILFESDFSKGDFSSQSWKAKGPWDIFKYPAEAKKNPGPVARFAANQPEHGRLTREFAEVSDPARLVLSLDYGWGWGDKAQAADGVAFMLLDAQGAGYFFKIHRTKANWALQWAKVTGATPPRDTVWASEEIDATHVAVRDGGGLAHVTVTRESGGAWTISSDDWNQSQGAALLFSDATTSSFSQVVLLGEPNFDEPVFNKIKLEILALAPTVAIPASRFLDSIGVVTGFPDRGQPLEKTVEMVKYCGFRWVRGGIEGLTEQGPTTIETYLELHKQTGVKFNWGLVSGGGDLDKLLSSARRLAEVDALLAFEGNNEPNNWGVTYQGEAGGGRAPSWMAVAKLQRDLYQAVKSDPLLKKYPVWSISASGAETDNVGLQFLQIPEAADTLMPAGTRYADFANVHNYIYHPNASGLEDNKTWNAADPTPACKIDGLYGNHGLTWAKKFRGYSSKQLLTLPRVTTETGCTIGGPVTEEIQANNLLSLYLDQFKRGWSYTSVYLLRDRGDEAGNQTFGFFDIHYKPRKAALYLHNLTAILADRSPIAESGRLTYSIPKQPITMHDLLLQKGDGTFQLVIWNERLQGSDDVTVKFDHPLKRMAIYDPTVGTEPIQTVEKVDQIQLTLGDHPQILAISEK